MIRQAAEGGYAPYAWELPWTAGWSSGTRRAGKCWPRLRNPRWWSPRGWATSPALAMARQHLGWLRFLLGDIDSAVHHLDDAVELATRLGDVRLRALAGLSRAQSCSAQDASRSDGPGRAVRWRSTAPPVTRGEGRALYTISGSWSGLATTSRL